MLSTSSEMKPLPLSMRSKTASELRLLAEIIGRRRRPPSTREKKGLLLWEAVTKEFNAIPWVSKRTPLQLRKFWGNHKCRDPIISVEAQQENGDVNRNEEDASQNADYSSYDGEEGGNIENVNTECDSDNETQDTKFVPEIEITTEPESVLEVSRNGQLNFYPKGSLDVSGPLSPMIDVNELGIDRCSEEIGSNESVRFQQEEHELRIAMLRQQQIYRQVEHAAKVEEHEAAMKIFELQKEYWKRKINKL